jgi:hypothetical protein
MGSSLPSVTKSPPACRTPGAAYGTQVSANEIVLRVKFPRMVFTGWNSKSVVGRHLEAELHAALLPAIEKIYRDYWEVFRGRTLDGDETPLPQTWEEL